MSIHKDIPIEDIHFVIGYLQKLQEDLPTFAGLLTLPINRLRIIAGANIKEGNELPSNATSTETRFKLFLYDTGATFSGVDTEP